MSIFRKEHLAEPLASLERYYLELKALLEGSTPSANTAHRHGFEDLEHFASEHTEVDWRRLSKAIGHFKIEVEELKSLKDFVINPPRQP